DINFSYFNFNIDRGDSVSAPPGTRNNFNISITPIDNNILPPLGNVFSSETLPIFGAARVKYVLNQIDLSVGQYINLGCHLIFHPKVGLRWVSLDRKLDSFFVVPDLIAPGNAAIREESDLNGMGPLIGTDVNYYLGWGFGVVGHWIS